MLSMTGLGVNLLGMAGVGIVGIGATGLSKAGHGWGRFGRFFLPN